MKRLVLLTVAVAAALAGLATAGNFPEPSAVPIAWELEFQALDVIKPIRVTLPGDNHPTTFWYLRYRITNNTGQDRQFIPSFDLCTNTGHLFTDRTTVPKVVFGAIKKLHNQPILQDVAGMTGKLLQGDDNAKEGVAIWPDFDHEAGFVEVYVGHLSGEEQVIKLPAPVEMTYIGADGKTTTRVSDEIVLYKQTQLTYAVPGEAAGRFITPAQLVKKRWVMR